MTVIPESPEVAGQDQKVHELIEKMTKALENIPGVTGVELVMHTDSPNGFAAWGFLYGEMPCSVSWNITQ